MLDRDTSPRPPAGGALEAALLTGILGLVDDVVILADTDLRIVRVNASAERTFGRTADELVGSPLTDLVPARFRSIVQLAIERASDLAVGSPAGSRRALVGLRRDGVEFPIEARFSRVASEREALVVGVLCDVGEARRREAAQRFLASAGEVLVATLDRGQILRRVAELAVSELAEVCLVDLVDDGQPRRLLATGRTREGSALAALGRPLPGRPSPHVAAVLASRRPAQPASVDGRRAALARDGADRAELDAIGPRDAIAIPLVARDELLGAITLLAVDRTYDLEDVQLAEELGIRAALSLANAGLYAIAQRAIRARDEVLGVVAHDLRNPLTTILGRCDLLLCPPAGQSERRSPRHVLAIQRAVGRMEHLIRDLLDVTRLDAGRLAIAPDWLVVPDLVADAIEAQAALATQAAVELSVTTSPALPRAWADRDRTLQVLGNLIGNAIKFCHRDGRIAIRALERPGAIEVSVEDDGPGIAPDALPHVFDRFWQREPGAHRGVGLGLAIAKGLVEAQGGQIAVDSTPGLGSVFRFTVPTSPIEPATDATTDSEDVVRRMR